MDSLIKNSESPFISMICLDADDGYLEEYLSGQGDIHIEYVQITDDDSYEDIIDYIKGADSRYICFFEAGHIYDADRLKKMSGYLEQAADIQIAVSPRNYIDDEDCIISKAGLTACIYSGRAVLEHSILENQNVYGDLSTIMVSTEYAKNIPWDIPDSEIDTINRIMILYQMLYYGRVGFLDAPLVSVRLQERKTDREREYAKIADAYRDYTRYLCGRGLLRTEWEPPRRQADVSVHIKKEMTFFYTDKGEYYNLKPIADKAVLRGYSVEFTEDIRKEAEIGIYCQHANWLEPVNAKFSLILLHDLEQGHERWPDMWEGETWDKFDIGIVPGKTWADRWAKCACHSWANPRIGTFELGYPKSDLIDSEEIKERARQIGDKFGMKYDYSVLYAVSKECDAKEDDFIRALASLNVNLLIKQARWSDAYADVNQNIKEMRALHEGRFDNVYYIEPEESIMTALELCDMVVSDDSSVMAEAIMFGKPALSCVDWLTPETPSEGFALLADMDYILKCKKVELREYVEKLSSHTLGAAVIDEVLEKGKYVFTNKGSCCDDILDAIEYYTGESKSGKEKPESGFLKKKLEPLYVPCSLWN
ncbi:MAG: hypothetical protein K2G89_07570 [Lachnospiraceae bacterium]|nr:hypothetical protein [Lachnospiraceae bacterium]